MPIRGFDFSRLRQQPRSHEGLRNIFQNYQQGLYGGREREANIQQAYLANQLAQRNAENYEEDRGLANALKTSQINRNMQSAEGGNLHGIPGEFAGLDRLLKNTNIPDHIKDAAVKAFQQRERLQESLANNRNMQTATANKRASSGLGKAILERQEVQNGFLPGSNRQVPLNSDQKKALEGKYDSEMLKKITDRKTRDRVEASINIDKTLDSFTPEALVRYSGLSGALKGLKGNIGSLKGKASPEYKEYEEAVSLSELLAKQVRQFYGDSITKNATKELKALTNPSTWSRSPEIALSKFNAFANTLRKETKTYRNALHSPDELLGNNENQSVNQNQQIGAVSGLSNEELAAIAFGGQNGR